MIEKKCEWEKIFRENILSFDQQVFSSLIFVRWKSVFVQGDDLVNRISVQFSQSRLLCL